MDINERTMRLVVNTARLLQLMTVGGVRDPAMDKKMVEDIDEIEKHLQGVRFNRKG